MASRVEPMSGSVLISVAGSPLALIEMVTVSSLANDTWLTKMAAILALALQTALKCPVALHFLHVALHFLHVAFLAGQ